MEELLFKLNQHFYKLHISDIEPWTEYRIEGIWLFELKELIRSGVDD